MNNAVRLLSLLLLLSPATVLAGEKVQGKMHSAAQYSRDACFFGYAVVPTSAAFINGTSSGRVVFNDKCRLKIILGKLADPGTLPLSDNIPGTGDEVICQVHMINSTAGACETIVVRGEVRGLNPAARKIVINANLGVETPAQCTPGTGTARLVSHVECYEPSPGYTIAGAGCAGSIAPFASDPTQGWCHGSSANLANPPSDLIAVMGVTQ